MSYCNKPTNEPQKMNKQRISITEYGMILASAASERSEDPWRKVGAVAFDKDNRVIGMAYNGLPAGFNAPDGFFNDRDARRKYMIHAETNLCSLFVRGAAPMVFVTTLPCVDCFKTLVAHGVTTIRYGEGYPDSDSIELAELFNIKLEKVEQ